MSNLLSICIDSKWFVTLKLVKEIFLSLNDKVLHNIYLKLDRTISN